MPKTKTPDALVSYGPPAMGTTQRSAAALLVWRPYPDDSTTGVCFEAVSGWSEILPTWYRMKRSLPPTVCETLRLVVPGELPFDPFHPEKGPLK